MPSLFSELYNFFVVKPYVWYKVKVDGQDETTAEAEILKLKDPIEAEATSFIKTEVEGVLTQTPGATLAAVETAIAGKIDTIAAEVIDAIPVVPSAFKAAAIAYAASLVPGLITEAYDALAAAAAAPQPAATAS
jgi:hypothetical protein